MKFLGGLYAVALPTAEYAVLYPGAHIESIWGQIDLPGFDILEFDITAHDGGKLAGKAQSDDPNQWGTWLWRASTRQWERVSASAHGTYPCIFANDGTLVLADGTQHGSQGFRYVGEDGRLVSGDDTLNAQRRVGLELGLSDLWEYSHFAGVTIGQGDPPIGCHVLIDGTRRMLEPGGTHFIRVKYTHGVYAISMTKLAENTAVIHRMTRAELLMLPLVTTPPPPPVIEPPPTPEPPVSEIPDALNDQSALVHEIRDGLFPGRHPLNDPAKAMLMTKHVAWRLRQHGVGLVKAKPGSENNVDGYTSDIVALSNGAHWDIQQDGHTGAAFAQWSLEPNPDNWAAVKPRWVPAVQPEGVPTPGPIEPTPGPQPVPDTELAKRLDAVEKRLQRLENAGLMVAQVFRP